MGQFMCVCVSCGQTSVAVRQDAGAGRKTKFIILLVLSMRSTQGYRGKPAGGQEPEDRGEGREHSVPA